MLLSHLASPSYITPFSQISVTHTFARKKPHANSLSQFTLVIDLDA